MNMAEIRHFTGLRGTLTRDAPLAKYTTWRAGGRAGAALFDEWRELADRTPY